MNAGLVELRAGDVENARRAAKGGSERCERFGWMPMRGDVEEESEYRRPGLAGTRFGGRSTDAQCFLESREERRAVGIIRVRDMVYVRLPARSLRREEEESRQLVEGSVRCERKTKERRGDAGDWRS